MPTTRRFNPAFALLILCAISCPVQSQTFSVIHEFTGGTDGQYPTTLIGDSSENIYGATSSGGGNQSGVIFEIDAQGSEKILHTFDGTDGYSPNGNLLLYSGVLYGMTSIGGDYNYGVVY